VRRRTTAVEIKEQLAERMNIGTTTLRIDPQFGWHARVVAAENLIAQRVLQQLADFYSVEMRKRYELAPTSQLH
jgi:hypothetical protein